MVFATVLVGHLASPMAVSADSLRAVFVGVAMLRRGELDLQGFSPAWTMGTDFGIVRAGGAWLPFFPWAPSLFVVPLLAVADVLLRATGGGSIEDRLSVSYTQWPFEVASMSLVVALTAMVVHAIARARLAALPARRREVVAVVVALVFAFGTSAWSTSSRSLWQHGPAMLFSCLALLGAVKLEAAGTRARWPALLLGASAASAFAMRPTSSLLIIALGLWLLARRPAAIGWAVLGGTVVTSLFVAVNLSQYGQVLPGYFLPGDTEFGAARGDLSQALLSNLVSPARGLLVFSPVLLLAFAGLALRVRRREWDLLDLSCLGLVVAHWVLVSSFADWWGGYSYGSRFMSDVIPPMVLLSLPAVAWLTQPRPPGASRRAVVATARVATAVLVVVSVAVHAEGAITRSSWCWNSLPADVNLHPERLWDWSDAQVTAGVRGIATNGWAAETVRGGTAQHGCEGLAR
ncbi:hypothetical protein [Modestobacter sp. VKM Ac-2985]|uniref:hypothetical protein n=1 Tax=Modestobacter sp. VKM Ac-2985 TaxID=3004139 RepID=UPI0022ABB086|nr:hypothetical protein [Modestobacter sp. VKM Ac-2985]MCZ2838596.1 hypothetical protein [Modestobacter sp. VKM Ac-2985]